MDAIDIPATTPTTAGPAPFEQCEQCGAPVESLQRYCVVCGVHRRHVPDPAATHLAAVGARARQAVARPRTAARPRSSSLATAILLAVVPLAIGLGVLVGRASTGGDGKLIAALRAQKPEIITAGAGGGAGGAPSAAVTNVASLSSDFPLQHGFSVELGTLPAQGTDQARVTRAEAADRAHGAPSVGLIVQHDFRVTPSPPAGADVIYSGTYASKAAAEHALAKLAKHFPGAKVIAVQSVSSSSGAAGAGKVLARSVYGTAHQIAGTQATATQLAAGAAVVKRIQKSAGKSYVNQQRGLPDQISVP